MTEDEPLPRTPQGPTVIEMDVEGVCVSSPLASVSGTETETEVENTDEPEVLSAFTGPRLPREGRACVGTGCAGLRSPGL